MNALSTYLQQIEKSFVAGNATEHTYRPALQALLESLEAGIVATNEPKRIQCGAPDFILTRRQTPLGYVEAKDIGKSLDAIETEEQLKRYRSSLGNLILTDYLEFRWYVLGEKRLTARLATVAGKSKILLEPEGYGRVLELLNAFLKSDSPTVSSPKELAERMAHLARLICDIITRAISDEEGTGSLHQLMEGFRKTLLHAMTEAQFADMYAQTIAYGLFAARCNVPIGAHFTREHAAYDLPKTNPFLRKMFSHLAGIDLDDRLAWAVEDLTHLLAKADIASILTDFGKKTKQEDPVVHFYETFLGAYDPKLREARGVYYTPEPVVSYLVRSVDTLLKRDFNLPQGIADSSKVTIKKGKTSEQVHKVQILDPATGTATFLYSVIGKIHESFANNKGMWNSYVRDHLLPRIIGFELLMAPYTVAHMKLGLLLGETGYNFESNERLRIYLTNTLEEADEYAGYNLFAQFINEEANASSLAKAETPVMVVIGNPPYSGHSANTGEWIAGLLRGKDTKTGIPTGNYFEVDGQPLGERNPKWLNDDYVKFIRFSQWRIERTGYGILAFITNHGYLDNPTFRGMRQSLMETFDDIYVMDLHGNSKKKERSPDGTKDENVFDIQQGVAICLMVKRTDAKKQAKVRHAHLWGTRGSKYQALLDSDVTTTEWQELSPSKPFYLLVPQDIDLLPEYNQGWSIPKLFEVFASTVTTARNSFSMGYDARILIERVGNLLDKSETDESLRNKYPALKDVSYWKLATARKELSGIKEIAKFVRPYAYRPFDFRFVFYHSALCERLRAEAMIHMKAGNIAFLTHRPQSPEEFTFAYCTRMIGDQCIAANKSSGGGNSFQFPLYLYPNGTKAHLFDEDAPTDLPNGRRANLAPEFIAEFSQRVGLSFIPDGKGDLNSTFGPEDVFDYMYAVFHCPTYRSRYAEFLKIDFPRLPLTSKSDLFRDLCALGSELVGLHLMEKTGTPLPSYPKGGSNTVEAVRYSEPTPDSAGRVWINKEQYFEGVSPQVWQFQIGGYQVCQKWLKDRKGRTLSYDDLLHYQKICGAISETIRLMTAIDATIEGYGGFPLA